MIWITEAKLFKGSKYKNRILAAIDNPINKPLIQQLTSYIDSKYVEELVSKKGSSESENVEVSEQQSDSEDLDIEEESNDTHTFSEPKVRRTSLNSEKSGLKEDELKESEVREENSGDVEESICISSKNKVIASSYVTMEDVSQAIKFIPGTLNLTEDTCGVTYVTIKGNPASEVWIYYNSDIDINKVLMGLNSTLIESGYTFLSFNRVARDENAVVFTINWATTYYQQPELEDESNE